MKRMLWLMLPAWLALVQISTPLVQAQQPGTSLHLHLKIARKLPTAQPLPDPKLAEKDAEQGIAEIKARERSEELVRELMQSRFRRPDLDRDVISGIQSRNLTDALRRR